MSEAKINITMRTPFLPHQISKLPKPTKAQTDEVKADFKKGVRCEICGGWHHPKVVHLDYVGHAALTDRLLDVDLNWSWEPLAFDEKGFPALDGDGGLWIRLTVLGVTRLGFGDAQGKVGGDAMKERIGDALRNAAMRFGAALDLWHKGDLHLPEETEEKVTSNLPKRIELKISDLERYSKDTLDADGVVTTFSPKSKIQQGEKTAIELINFLSSKFTVPQEVVDIIKSWESKK